MKTVQGEGQGQGCKKQGLHLLPIGPLAAVCVVLPGLVHGVLKVQNLLAQPELMLLCPLELINHLVPLHGQDCLEA